MVLSEREEEIRIFKIHSKLLSSTGMDWVYTVASCYDSRIHRHSLCHRQDSPEAHSEMEIGVYDGFRDQHLEGNGWRWGTELGREREELNCKASPIESPPPQQGAPEQELFITVILSGAELAGTQGPIQSVIDGELGGLSPSLPTIRWEEHPRIYLTTM